MLYEGKRKCKKGGKIPDFWPIKKHEVPFELKEWVIQQYYSQEHLSVYCDASINHNKSLTGLACTYVSNGMIRVKQQYSHPPRGMKELSPWYAEMKAIIFALHHFEKHVGTCCEVTFFTDLKDIPKILGHDPMFKNNSDLQNVRKELKQLYNQKHSKYGDKLSIQYLTPEKKRFNPLHKSAHNAAREMIML